MIWTEYEAYKGKYEEAKMTHLEKIQIKEDLFRMTQPQGISYDSEHVSGGQPVSKFDSYLILKEKMRLDEQIEESKALMQERLNLLKSKERELRSSKDVEDQIYVLRYLENALTLQICKKVHFSKATVNRTLKKIKLERILSQNESK